LGPKAAPRARALRVADRWTHAIAPAAVTAEAVRLADGTDQQRGPWYPVAAARAIAFTMDANTERAIALTTNRDLAARVRL
jgi:hypothetical protein